MPFSTPRRAVTSYLVLRHLADGDVIDWPLPEHHPKRELFDALEAQGFIARWNRMWPFSDRYRLTERGISTLEAVYRPAGAEDYIAQLRARNLSPEQRRAELTKHRLDPVIWPILHDPYTHWSTIDQDQGLFYRFFWEDQRPPRRKPAPSKPPVQKPAQERTAGPRIVAVRLPRQHDDDATLVDLDHDARDPGYFPPNRGDYDVS